LTVLSLLNQGNNPSKISKELSISKQKINYYIRRLKNEGLINKIGYGTWEVKQVKLFNSNTPPYKQVKIFNSDILPKKDKKIRGHAFIWSIKLPQEIKDWKERLEKLKIDYRLVRGKTPRIWLNKKKIWLGQNTITLYESNSYYGYNAIESRKYAIVSLLEDLERLEKLLKINLGEYIFHPCREHYALIKNDLARQCNRNGEKINISDNNGEWLWIDKSDGIGELETGNHNALVNNIGVQRWWNDMKDTKFEWTPKVIGSNFIEMQNTLNQTIQAHELNAQNIIKHQNVLDEMLITLKKIQDKL